MRAGEPAPSAAQPPYAARERAVSRASRRLHPLPSGEPEVLPNSSCAVVTAMVSCASADFSMVNASSASTRSG